MKEKISFLLAWHIFVYSKKHSPFNKQKIKRKQNETDDTKSNEKTGEGEERARDGWKVSSTQMTRKKTLFLLLWIVCKKSIKINYSTPPRCHREQFLCRKNSKKAWKKTLWEYCNDGKSSRKFTDSENNLCVWFHDINFRLVNFQWQNFHSEGKCSRLFRPLCLMSSIKWKMLSNLALDLCNNDLVMELSHMYWT